VPDLDQQSAREWIDRWDRQQEVSLPDREDRFVALIDAVEAGAGRVDPVVLDIGCGPGSLAVRLKDRLPQATIIGIDADPVTLALARAAHPDLRVVDIDLRVAGWPARLGLDRPVDVAVSTTALHWLPEPQLRAFYAELASALKPGGLLLNGDHFKVDAKQTPVLARLDTALREREDARRFPAGHQESWTGWWEAVAADPALAGYSAERDRRRVDAGHHGTESTQLQTHVDALKAAGFAEIGTLWQRGDNRVLCAVMPEAGPFDLRPSARVGDVDHADHQPDQYDQRRQAVVGALPAGVEHHGGAADGQPHRAEA
jgi:SAM-dependent methyltransferase